MGLIRFSYKNQKRVQQIYPYLGGVLGAGVFLILGIIVPKNVLEVTVNVASITFGFAMAFVGIIFSSAEHSYLKAIRKKNTRPIYNLLVSYIKQGLYASLIFLIVSYAVLIEPIMDKLVQWQLPIIQCNIPIVYIHGLWIFVFIVSLLCMLRLSRIMIGLLETIDEPKCPKNQTSP